MHDNIVNIANERVLTAADFEQYVCAWDAPSQYDPPIHSFATFDAECYPNDGESPRSGEVVGMFFVRRILDANTVEIGLVYVPTAGIGILTYVGMHLDADELAIRMEDS